MEPERAHEFALKLLDKSRHTGALAFMYSNQRKPVRCMDIDFKNPVGLAAGLDKNGDYIDALAALGFGFLEIGTITPKPQAGNHPPRLFRLKPAEAIINRMGFNNAGVDALINNVKNAKYKGVLGINIGKNAVTPVENAADDYLHCLERVYNHASYITVNISSPNTKNLRDLQQGDALNQLLDALKNRQSQLATQHGHYVPLVLKVAPDLDEVQITHIAQALLDHEVDGLIATNTSVERMDINHLPEAGEAGGLSGAPIFVKSTQALRAFSSILSEKVPIIGVGGINSGERAALKQQAGASLVQLYTGLIYQGPALIQNCVEAFDTDALGSSFGADSLSASSLGGNGLGDNTMPARAAQSSNSQDAQEA